MQAGVNKKHNKTFYNKVTEMNSIIVRSHAMKCKKKQKHVFTLNEEKGIYEATCQAAARAQNVLSCLYK